MSGLVECSLYGCIADVTSIERRMADMGAVREEQKECHTLYAPSPSEGEHGREYEREYEHGFPPPNYPPATPRTSSLLHLVTTSGGCVRIVSYRAGDFGTEERTNVMNVTECALLGTGSPASLEGLLSSLDYSPMKCTEYASIRFTLVEGVVLCLLRTGTDPWLAKLSGRCADKLGVPDVEASLFTVATYLDE